MPIPSADTASAISLSGQAEPLAFAVAFIFAVAGDASAARCYVRFTSDSGRIAALPRTAALCQVQTSGPWLDGTRVRRSSPISHTLARKSGSVHALNFDPHAPGFNPMRRREFITLLGGVAAWPVAARAQQSSGRPLVGILSPLSETTATRNIEGFREGLRELGYVEGRNITIALRFANGMPERMPALAAELAALKPDVIIAAPESSLAAVRGVTRTIPVITIWLQDPVLSGAADAIARPGGHVTGTWIAGDDALVGKQLELLKEAVPAAARVGVFVNSAEVTDKAVTNLLTVPARALGLTITVIEVSDAAGIEAAFAAAASNGAQALFVSQSPFFNTHRVEIAERAQRARLPAIYGFREFAIAGGMMSYGPSLPAVYRRFATLVDKILKGESPANLPIEVPTRFELVINLKAAKAIDLAISESFLVRVDEVIE